MEPRPRVPYQGYPYTKPMVTDAVPSSPAAATTPTKPSRWDKIPYQGFPYVNPIVTDAPSLNPAEVAALAKWQNLPRRPLNPYGTDGGRSPTSDTQSSSKEFGFSRPSNSKSDLDPDRPTVYIDIPQGSGGVSERLPDLDGNNSNGVAGGSRHNRGISSGSKEDLDLDRPVVYIDIPDNNGSEVSQSIEEQEPAYVQDTIFYDQFKNRRIELPRDSDSEESQSVGSTLSPGSTASRPGFSRPPVPNSLNIGSPGSSGFGSAPSSLPNSYTQTYLNKESSIYGPTANDEFHLTPLPVNDFPAYPPPYEEIQQSTVVTPPPNVVTEQPRTQVITTVPPIPQSDFILNERRKLVTCQHCNATVQTLVVEEYGFYTHVLAAFLCLFVAAFGIIVYLFNCFKYKNHYCPNCNKKIAYQYPCGQTDHLTYVS